MNKNIIFFIAVILGVLNLECIEALSVPFDGKLILDKLATNKGASYKLVFYGSYGGKPSIVKITSNDELKITLDVQNEKDLFVVKLYESSDISSLVGYKGSLISEKFFSKAYKVLVMEQLETVSSWYTLDGAKELSFDDIKQWEEIEASVTEEKKKIVLDCALAFNYLHSKEIAHRDIKQENMGYDKQGRLKIFDFGESEQDNGLLDYYTGHYDLTYIQDDIIALGKLFINILTGKYIFAPGRHYNAHRFGLDQKELFDIFDKIKIDDKELKGFIKTMLHVEKETFDPSILMKIINYLKR
ncbi:protein kinase [Candidatus Babeliales bacterium]|nr:protein kinase [Candidatus Babeliales bacterium]